MRENCKLWLLACIAATIDDDDDDDVVCDPVTMEA